MNFLLQLILALFLLIVARWANKKWKNTDSNLYWVALFVHVTCAMAVGLIYLFYYNFDDTWTYFGDAEKLAQLARINFSSYLNAMWADDALINSYVTIANEEWRSVFFIKVLSVLCLISNDNYWMSAAYLSTFSFFSCWNLHIVICSWKPQASYASAFAFLFFPSVVFWGSGIEKETLALAGLFFLAACLIRFGMNGDFKWQSLPLIIVSVFFLLKLRYFWLAVLLMVGIPTILILYLNSKGYSKIKIAIIILSTLAVVGFTLTFIHPNFSPDIFLEVVVQNNRQLVSVSDHRKVIHFHQLTPNWGSVLVNSPLALFSGLFRPFMWEASSVLALLASVENSLLLMLTVMYFLNFKKMVNKKNRVLFLGALAYIAILCVFLALSTPNFGTLSRYRIGFLPFFVFIISYKNPLIVSIKQFIPKRKQ